MLSHTPPLGDTAPRFQSTTRPLNAASMFCMYVRPFSTTWEAKTSLPRRLARGFGSTSRWPSVGSLANQSVISASSFDKRFAVSVIPCLSRVLHRRRPRNSMHWQGPRRL